MWVIQTYYMTKFSVYVFLYTYRKFWLFVFFSENLKTFLDLWLYQIVSAVLFDGWSYIVFRNLLVTKMEGRKQKFSVKKRNY